MNDDAMRYSRYANTYRSRTGDLRCPPSGSASAADARAIPASRYAGFRHVPHDTAWAPARANCSSFAYSSSAFYAHRISQAHRQSPWRPMLGGNGKATATAAASSTPQSEWKRGATPALYQTDPQWASTSYANDTLEKSGCGPTCLSMVYVNLTGRKEMDPPKMCAYSERMGFVDKGATSWEFMTEGARGLGLNAEELPADKGMIKGRVSAGHPVIAIMGPGDFTTTGHLS